ncbi:hypothetical protein MMC26_001797 [Xylographa opegraphella]|nr:hypothetical protein [Xylographa opegraphella]
MKTKRFHRDCAVDIARLAVITSFFGEADFTYLYAQVQWWDMLHTSIGIIAICLPTIRMLILKMSDVLQGYIHSSKSNSTNGYLVGRWNKSDQHYNELNDAAIALTGETGRTTHNNALALALNQQSKGSTAAFTGENAIQVTNDVIVESTLPPAVPPEAHLANQV